VLDSRPEFVRVILKWSENNIYPKAYSTGNQISSKLLNCRNANALLMLPEKNLLQEELDKETVVNAMLLGFNHYAGQCLEL
jgi:molybdopterin biosynthesis enzyme